MHRHTAAGHGIFHCFQIADVSLDKFHFGRKVFFAATGEIIQDNGLFSLRQKAFDNIGTDEASTAGNQDFVFSHHFLRKVDLIRIFFEIQ